MFFKRRKGLRPIKTTFFLFLLILLIPVFSLIFFYFLKIIILTPICKDYEQILQQCNSENNEEVIFAKSLITATELASKVLSGFLPFKKGKVYKPIFVPNNDATFYYEGDKFVEDSQDGFQQLEFLMFMTYLKEIDYELETFMREQESIVSDKKKFEGGGTSIKPKKEWELELLHHANNILNTIQIPHRRDFPVLTKMIKEETFPYPKTLWGVMYLTILIQLKERDYDTALYYINSMNDIAYLMEEGTFSLTRHWFEYVSSLLSYPNLPVYFYEEVLCSFMELKEKFREKDLQKVYRFTLFDLEDEFSYLLGDKVRMNNYEDDKKKFRFSDKVLNYVNCLRAYINTVRRVEQLDNIIASITWKDLEEGILLKRGKIYTILTQVGEYNGKYFSKYEETVHTFKFPTITHFLFSYYNYIRNLSSVYAMILIVLCEHHHSTYGTYPDNLEEMLGSYLSDEDLQWISKYIEIKISPDNYIISCYYTPRPLRGTYGHRIRCFTEFPYNEFMFLF